MKYQELKKILSTMKWGGIYIGVLAYYKEYAPEWLDLKVAEINKMSEQAIVNRITKIQDWRASK